MSKFSRVAWASVLVFLALSIPMIMVAGNRAEALASVVFVGVPVVAGALGVVWVVFRSKRREQSGR
ncbi:hypothetical protein ON058_01005 [Demequina sp. B12]|uniref:hypothetical protein n=1 Tax=Demequina sp. B12 TaxID=2992757 RepID=UPI00237BFC28|nr:hypothetical protein [Demequina sp. B12]MDE0571992.1 hypothetical protein [Demequina sp. B12]